MIQSVQSQMSPVRLNGHTTVQQDAVGYLSHVLASFKIVWPLEPLRCKRTPSNTLGRVHVNRSRREIGEQILPALVQPEDHRRRVVEELVGDGVNAYVCFQAVKICGWKRAPKPVSER
tara:strand:+ start:5775 stop:6128 length:354 start_codon:yes stop_codon:yes gene_type:complete